MRIRSVQKFLAPLTQKPAEMFMNILKLSLSIYLYNGIDCEMGHIDL